MQGESKSSPQASRYASGGRSVERRSLKAAVADLVVVLHADDEVGAVGVAHAGAVAVAAKPAVAAVIDEDLADRLGQMRRPAEVHGSSRPMAGEQGMDAWWKSSAQTPSSP